MRTGILRLLGGLTVIRVHPLHVAKSIPKDQSSSNLAIAYGAMTLIAIRSLGGATAIQLIFIWKSWITNKST